VSSVVSASLPSRSFIAYILEQTQCFFSVFFLLSHSVLFLLQKQSKPTDRAEGRKRDQVAKVFKDQSDRFSFHGSFSVVVGCIPDAVAAFRPPPGPHQRVTR